MAKISHRIPSIEDVGKLVEVCDDIDPSDQSDWQQLRLAGIDFLNDKPFVCIPTQKRWSNDCGPWEITIWKNARVRDRGPAQ